MPAGPYRLPTAGRDGVLVRRQGALGRRATENEVREFFAPYEEHAALARIYALQCGYI